MNTETKAPTVKRSRNGQIHDEAIYPGIWDFLKDHSVIECFLESESERKFEMCCIVFIPKYVNILSLSFIILCQIQSGHKVTEPLNQRFPEPFPGTSRGKVQKTF